MCPAKLPQTIDSRHLHTFGLVCGLIRPLKWVAEISWATMKSLVRCLILLVACVALTVAIGKGRCGLIKAQPGPCLASFRRWSFDVEKNACVFFVYGGCGGNANRFESEAECLRTCKEAIF